MLRKLIILGLICLFLQGASAFAGGAGDCITPIKTTTEYVGLGAAFEYNGVSGRMMDLMNNKSGSKDMRVDHLNQYYGKVILGVFDNFNLYTKVGGCNYTLRFKEEVGEREVIMKMKNGIYGGGGINALFPLVTVGKLPISIGGDVQGSLYFNDVNSIDRGGVSATDVQGSFFGLDGQNSLYVSCKYDIENLKTSIIPYIGAYQSWIVIGGNKSVSYATADGGGAVVTGKYSPAFDVLSFGLLLGVDVDIAKYFSINVAGRFVGETAITTGATVKF